jgi:hypothetical protein
MPDTDPAALVAAIRDRNEAYIKSMAFTEATVREMPSGDLRLALAAVDAVLELHSEWRIYEECDHPRILDSDYGCPDCYCYSICRSCCAGDGSGQTEQCASDHDVMHCWPCPTYLAICAALLGQDRTDA